MSIFISNVLGKYVIRAFNYTYLKDGFNLSIISYENSNFKTNFKCLRSCFSAYVSEGLTDR